jgi:hypothetical protein
MRKISHLRRQNWRPTLVAGYFAAVWFERNEGDNLQHPGFEDGQALAGVPHFSLAGSLPQDSCARDIAPPPDLPQDAGHVKLFDALALLGNQFGGKGFRWKRVGTTARKR